MVKGIFIEVNNVLIDATLIQASVWKTVFNKNQIAELLTPSLKDKLLACLTIKELQELLKKLINSSEAWSKKNLSAKKLTAEYKEALFKLIENDAECLHLNNALLNSIEETYKNQKIDFYIINNSLFSDYVIKKLDLLKRYNFLKLCWEKKETKDLQKKSGIFVSLTSKNSLIEIIQENHIDTHDVIVIANSVALIKATYELGSYVVAIDCDSDACYNLNLHADSVNIDQIIYQYYAQF